jgi:regulator of replication initiation timing
MIPVENSILQENISTLFLKVTALASEVEILKSKVNVLEVENRNLRQAFHNWLHYDCDHSSDRTIAEHLSMEEIKRRYELGLDPAFFEDRPLDEHNPDNV